MSYVEIWFPVIGILAGTYEIRHHDKTLTLVDTSSLELLIAAAAIALALRTPTQQQSLDSMLAASLGDNQRLHEDGWDSSQWKGNENWITAPPEKPRRIQDIAPVGVAESQPIEGDSNKPWPFDSSPCALYGGKNTRKGGETMNAGLFKTSFSTEGKFDMDEYDTETGDSFADEENTSSETPVAREPPMSSTRASSVEKEVDEVYRMAEEMEKNHHISIDDPKRPTETKVKSSRRSKELRRSASAVDEKPKKRSSRRRGDTLTSSSCHGDIEPRSRRTRDERSETPKPKRSSRRRNRGNDDLVGHTYHGEGPVSYSRGPSATRVLGRSRSAVSEEPSDDLGAASMHGTSSVSHVRRRRRTSVERSSSSKPRGNIKRAMSTHNVRRPEEYIPKTTTQDLYRGGNSSGPHDLYRRCDSEPSDSEDEFGADTPSESQADALNSNSFADNSVDSEVNLVLGTSQHSKKSESKTESKKSRKSESRKKLSGEPRRDLLLLLREQKKVSEQDFKDKENRRLLHFLIFEHKMGISLKQLHRHIRKEQQGGDTRTLGQRSPPLMMAESS